MDIKGNIHCLFEQSGTFKNEFKKLGYNSFDYDIQNRFNETDYVLDIFENIENAYDDKPSIFDNITKDDLIIAFFPCIYFCETSQCAFKTWHINYRKLSNKEMYKKIVKRIEDRAHFFTLLNKLFCIIKEKKLRMILENPYSEIGYLHDNFDKPTFIDHDRSRRGDYFNKPTQYWFVNCVNSYGNSYQKPKCHYTIRNSKSASKSGLCSEERSMISPDYARNFICDFIIGKVQNNSELNLFN